QNRSALGSAHHWAARWGPDCRSGRCDSVQGQQRGHSALPARASNLSGSLQRSGSEYVGSGDSYVSESGSPLPLFAEHLTVSFTNSKPFDASAPPFARRDIAAFAAYASLGL